MLPVTKAHPLLLNECSESLDCSVEWVQTQLSNAGDLAGEVPAVLQTQHHTAALDIHQICHCSSNLGLVGYEKY